MKQTNFAEGFTLIEMIVVVSIIGILASIAVPSFQSMLRNQRIKSASFELFSSLVVARSEAIKRNVDVVINPSDANNWQKGWNISAGNLIVKNQSAIAGVIISGAPSTLTYSRTGRITNTNSPAIQVDVDPVDAAQIRCITIDLSGLPRTKKGACS